MQIGFAKMKKAVTQGAFMQRWRFYSGLWLCLAAATGCNRLDLLTTDAADSLAMLDTAISRECESDTVHTGSYAEYNRTTSSSSSWLRFPVADKDCRDISSGYGASREGGKRHHEGIDIPADLNTPVVAVADCEVMRWDSSNLAGRELWLIDTATERMYYYAHLHKRLVWKKQQVHRGDTIALVGATGNTRNNPHLHFGIYITNFIDPAPFFPDKDAAHLIESAQSPRIRKEVEKELKALARDSEFFTYQNWHSNCKFWKSFSQDSSSLHSLQPCFYFWGNYEKSESGLGPIAFFACRNTDSNRDTCRSGTGRDRAFAQGIFTDNYGYNSGVNSFYNHGISDISGTTSGRAASGAGTGISGSTAPGRSTTETRTHAPLPAAGKRTPP
ncbi:MAG: peptidoglycan DD-metalloendopeptidase family protein [Chitinivibrionales bacterium]|nr:peptidoglycan DD-metalloendopeptidase family protein [Chitinivibrionales bacterium]